MIVDIKGVGQAQFPDDMAIADIRSFLRNKYYDRATQGQSDILSPQPQTASPYEPTLTERLGGGIAEGLKGTGLISDNYGAQQIGKSVTALGEFLPGIGDAAAGDDFGRALSEGNYGDAAIAGVGTIPVLGDMAIFAGALAKNADLGALKKAQALELQGKGRDEIWSETGWFNDKGDWKFEISDDKSKSRDLFKTVGDATDQLDKHDDVSTQLGKGLTHPQARKAYPDEFKDIDLTVEHKPFGGEDGSYSNGEMAVSSEAGSVYGPDKSLKPNRSTTLHETQHAIQEKEGFARGGSPDRFQSRLDSAKENYPIYRDLAEIKELMNDGYGEKAILNLYEGMPEQARAKEIFDDHNYNKWLTGGDWELSDFEKARDSAKRDLKPEFGPYESYQRLAGEAEARLVQTRMNMTPEQRRARPPWEDLDVPEDELIYRK